jgi:abequosyltransferase
MIRLSICISTINRGGLLAETLESIVPELTDEVELLILDGASTDNTQEVVGSFVARSPRVRCVRLEKAGGFDEKYCLLGELAAGEYCWMFADDDLLKPGAVAAVLEATRQDYSLIVVNAEVRSKDLAVCLQPTRINVPQNRAYSPTSTDFDHLLADTAMYLTYIGGIVIKRAVWNQRERQKYFGTLFVHIAVIFQSPLPGKSLVMAHPWIVIRYGNALWTPRSFELWMFTFPELIWSFPHFANWAKRKVERQEPWRCWHRLLMARAIGNYSSAEYSRWLEQRFRSALARLCGRTIAAMPIGPLNWLARFVAKWILRKSPSITLYDLERWRSSSARTS